MTVRYLSYTVLLCIVAVISVLHVLPIFGLASGFAGQDMSHPPMQVTMSFETSTSTWSETYFQTYTSTQSFTQVQDNTPLLTAGTAIGGAAVGYALNKGKRKLSSRNTCPMCGGTGHVSSTLPIQPGFQPLSPSIGPGQAPAIGPGTQPFVNPVSPGIRAIPFPTPRLVGSCVHCGKPIRAGVQFCPNCGIRARNTGPT